MGYYLGFLLLGSAQGSGWTLRINTCSRVASALHTVMVAEERSEPETQNPRLAICVQRRLTTFCIEAQPKVPGQQGLGPTPENFSLPTYLQGFRVRG